MKKTVSCKLCKATLNREVAYSPTGKSPYYCSEKEYLTNKQESEYNSNMKKSTYTLLHDEILQYDENQIILNKKLEQLGKLYSWEVVYKTFNLCKKDILFWVNNKSFDNEYFKMNYIMAIISNKINDVYLQNKREKLNGTIKQDTYIDVNLLNDDFTRKTNNSNDISQFL